MRSFRLFLVVLACCCAFSLPAYADNVYVTNFPSYYTGFYDSSTNNYVYAISQNVGNIYSRLYDIYSKVSNTDTLVSGISTTLSNVKLVLDNVKTDLDDIRTYTYQTQANTSANYYQLVTSNSYLSDIKSYLSKLTSSHSRGIPVTEFYNSNDYMGSWSNGTTSYAMSDDLVVYFPSSAGYALDTAGNYIFLAPGYYSVYLSGTPSTARISIGGYIYSSSVNASFLKIEKYSFIYALDSFDSLNIVIYPVDSSFVTGDALNDSFTSDFNSSASSIQSSVDSITSSETDTFTNINTSLTSLDFSASNISDAEAGFDFVAYIFNNIWNNFTAVQIICSVGAMFGVMQLILRSRIATYISRSGRGDGS